MYLWTPAMSNLQPSQKSYILIVEISNKIFFNLVFEPSKYHGKVERFLLSMLRYFILFARVNVMHEIRGFSEVSKSSKSIQFLYSLLSKSHSNPRWFSKSWSKNRVCEFWIYFKKNIIDYHYWPWRRRIWCFFRILFSPLPIYKIKNFSSLFLSHQTVMARWSVSCWVCWGTFFVC